MSVSRAELQTLGARGLRERAQRVGVPAQAIEDARDSADPKGQLVELIVAEVDQLNAMGMRDLRARAAQAGVSAHAIDEARDGAEPKRDLIALIIGNQTSTPAQAPLPGAIASPAPAPAPAPAAPAPATSHVSPAFSMPSMPAAPAFISRPAAPAPALEMQRLTGVGLQAPTQLAEPTYTPAFIVRYMRQNKWLPGFPKGGAPFFTKLYAKCLAPCAYGEVESWLRPSAGAGSDKWCFCCCLDGMICARVVRVQKSEVQRQRIEEKIHTFHQQMGDPNAQGPVFSHKGAGWCYCLCSDQSILAENLHVKRTFEKLQGDTKWMPDY